ncbi:MAG: acetate--CoA ligase family protein [bacterium]|nr:acetate--CoA ligase family protein [bacterium]
MRLYEYEAKKVFGSMGLTIPKQYGVIHSPDDLKGLDLTYPVMLKSMVLIGGRGKAGGIKKAKDLAEAKSKAADILKLVIKGYPVDTLLVEEVANEAGACYLGITTHPATFNVIMMASAEGGVDIETIALEKPEAILKKEIPENNMELPEDLAEEFAKFLNTGLKGNEKLKASLKDAIKKLYATFQAFDCKTAEINPLIVTTDNIAVAADAKVVIDDNALYRQGGLFELLGIAEARHDVSELTKDEQRARDGGFKYVDPSRFGGISSCDTFIKGTIKALRDRFAKGQRMLPIVGRMVGTDLPSAREFLQKAKIETPEALKDLDIAVGNEKIMADVIKDGIAKGFEVKQAQAATASK